MFPTGPVARDENPEQDLLAKMELSQALRSQPTFAARWDREDEMVHPRHVRSCSGSMERSAISLKSA